MSCDGLAFRTRGQRVLVLGAPRTLFDATVALLPIVRGTLLVGGALPIDAVRQGRLAGAFMNPPLPPRWTGRDYVAWSARLSGLRKSDASKAAETALALVQLGPFAKTELARLVPHARRATTVAAALATGAEIIALEDPLGGLPEDVATAYGNVLVDALRARSWIAFAPRVPRASPLALACDEVIIASSTELEMQGSPDEIATSTKCFRARILGSISAIAPLLESRGARVEERGAHLFFDLGEEMTTTELMTVCANADVAILELVPAIRALS